MGIDLARRSVYSDFITGANRPGNNHCSLKGVSIMAIKKTAGRGTTRDYSILSQLRGLRSQWLATGIGCVVGAIVPVLVYRIAHHHVSAAPALWLIVAGGLLFSASSVYGWGLKLFGGAWYKALGLTLLIELSTVFIEGWESYVALSVLCVINAVNMAHALVVGNRQTRRK